MSTTPLVVIAPSVGQLLKSHEAEELRHIDLANFLAAVRVFYTKRDRVPAAFQGAVNVPVPVEVLDLLGNALVGRSKWAQVHNAARKAEAADKKAYWQREAEKVWRRHPNLSNARVAKMIAPEEPGVRRKITKPKK